MSVEGDGNFITIVGSSNQHVAVSPNNVISTLPNKQSYGLYYRNIGDNTLITLSDESYCDVAHVKFGVAECLSCGGMKMDNDNCQGYTTIDHCQTYARYGECIDCEDYYILTLSNSRKCKRIGIEHCIHAILNVSAEVCVLCDQGFMVQDNGKRCEQVTEYGQGFIGNSYKTCSEGYYSTQT